MRTKRTTISIGLRVFAGLMLLLTGWLGAATSASAQASNDVAILTKENGQPAYDACYLLVGYSDVGCDENGDGLVMFASIPRGTYEVHQTADLGSGRTVHDFMIDVRGNVNSAGFESFSASIVTTGASSSSANAAGSSDVAIVTTENGQLVTDACFILVGYSDVGCDENGDGKITFQDVPLATYSVHQTADLGSGRSVADFSITVTGAASSDGWERFPATVRTTSGEGSSGSSASDSSGAKDISLVTRDPGTGSLLTGTCYILGNHSEEGCDENGDGQVTFAAMPPGTYTVHQTTTPAGYPAINDFAITVDDSFPNVPVGYLVKQAPDQNASGTRNVTFVFVDSQSSTKIEPAQICMKLGSASNVGCDEDLVDGQIDFLDVATGSHPLTFSNLPDGWQIMGDDRVGPSVTIDSGPGPQIVYIEVYTGSGGGSSTSSSAGSSDSNDCPTAGGLSCEVPGLVLGCAPSATCFGGTITASTEDGTILGRCTMTDDINDTSHPYSCGLAFTSPIKRGFIVVLTIDGIGKGYVAEQNPVFFDTANSGHTSHDTGFNLVPLDGLASGDLDS